MKKIMLFITLFLTAVNIVYAKEVTLIKERIDNVYTFYYDTDRGSVRYLYANRLLFDEETAYCLELGKAITSNIYTYTTSYEEYGISPETLDYLKLASYYGYNYENHNTDNYYMATQEIIWDKVNNASVRWVIGMDSANKIDITREKEEILSLINSHYTKPSFDNKEINFTIGKDLVIEDTNNVLQTYTTKNKNVVIEGNKLIIKENFNEEEITLTKKITNIKPLLLYTSEDSQKMISAGGVEGVTSSVKINITGGTLEINKLDKDTKEKTPQGEASLKGAVYQLYDENQSLIGELTTGTKNKIEKLPLGKYTLKEKTPSKGYLLDNTIYTFEITKNSLDIKLDVYEKVIERKIELFKVYASSETGELTPEPNISFEIYDKNKKLINTITTNTEGYASIILPYGTYTFKQNNSSPNYYKVEDFEVSISEYNEKPIYKLLSDSEITAKVKIIKKDLDTKENILNSNIKFKIYNVKEEKYLKLKVSYPENKVTEEFQIDKNGIFITPIALSPGKYILEEVKKPMDGYLYNSQKFTFTIGESSNFVLEDNEIYLEIPFYNKRVKGQINITKFGEEVIYNENTYNYKEIPLQNTKFHLYAKEEIYENNKLIYKKDQLVEESTTDKDGKITIDNLPLGKYYLKETITEDNHILDETLYDINLSYKDENTKIITHNQIIKNYLKKGKLIITKYDKETEIPLSNTLIEIRNKEDKIIYTGYTDENGNIILKDLPYGEYYLSEVEATTGYRILEDKMIFIIEKDETTLKIYNERIKVPNTGLNIKNTYILTIILIILGLITTIFIPKNKVVSIIVLIILTLGTIYLITNIYKYHEDNKNNQKSIDSFMNHEIQKEEKNEKYNYNSVLEIPSINIKRGILNIDNKYNDAKYNIQLIKENENTIVLAAHNGNSNNSFFSTLHTIELGAEINYYKNDKKYKYIYSETYDAPKDGYINLYYDDKQKSIILITCKENVNDAQSVYIGYLKEESSY